MSGSKDTLAMDEVQFTKVLSTGNKFLKYGRKGKPHRCLLSCTPGLDRISWGNVSSALNASDLLEVRLGRSTDVFARNEVDSKTPSNHDNGTSSFSHKPTKSLSMNRFSFSFSGQAPASPMERGSSSPNVMGLNLKREAAEKISFSLIFHDRTLDLEVLPAISRATMEETRDAFVAAFQWLIGVWRKKHIQKVDANFSGEAFDEKFEAVEDFRHEIKMLQQCESFYIVGYIGCWGPDTDKRLWVLMDYCEVGSVTNLFEHEESRFSEAQIGRILHSTLMALVYLNGKNLVHRDVKAGNILVNKSAHVKMADFGVSKKAFDAVDAGDLQDGTTSSSNDSKAEALSGSTVGADEIEIAGSPLWMAPEVLIGQVVFKSDIWSVGITAIELAERKVPYSEATSTMRVMRLIKNNTPPTLREKHWSQDFNDFIDKCLTKDTAARASSTELLSHPFMTRSMTGIDELKPLVHEHLARTQAKGSGKEKNSIMNSLAKFGRAWGQKRVSVSSVTSVQQKPPSFAQFVDKDTEESDEGSDVERTTCMIVGKMDEPVFEIDHTPRISASVSSVPTSTLKRQKAADASPRLSSNNAPRSRANSGSPSSRKPKETPISLTRKKSPDALPCLRSANASPHLSSISAPRSRATSESPSSRKPKYCGMGAAKSPPPLPIHPPQLSILLHGAPALAKESTKPPRKLTYPPPRSRTSPRGLPESSVAPLVLCSQKELYQVCSASGVPAELTKKIVTSAFELYSISNSKLNSLLAEGNPPAISLSPTTPHSPLASIRAMEEARGSVLKPGIVMKQVAPRLRNSPSGPTPMQATGITLKNYVSPEIKQEPVPVLKRAKSAQAEELVKEDVECEGEGTEEEPDEEKDEEEEEDDDDDDDGDGLGVGMVGIPSASYIKQTPQTTEARKKSAKLWLEESSIYVCTLSRNDVSTLKRMKNNATGPVKAALIATAIVLGAKPTPMAHHVDSRNKDTGKIIRKFHYWPSAQKILGDTNFLRSLKRFDFASLSPEVITRLYNYCTTINPSMSPSVVTKASRPAGVLWDWIRSIYHFAVVWLDFVPPETGVLATALAEFYDE